tara:strand:+ start:1086 stop:1385 length:300 start_codon:yes stop_codon:yes gene_type:complete
MKFLTAFFLYNSTVLAIRESYPLFPMPVFTFAFWLAGPLSLVLVLAMLSPLVFRGHRTLHSLSYLFSIMWVLEIPLLVSDCGCRRAGFWQEDFNACWMH